MIERISRARLVQLLDAAVGKRVTVIGDAMLDVYLTGEVDRISPEAPVPVVRVSERKMALGGAANVAQNITAIGAACEIVCAVGDDVQGRIVRSLLEDVGVATSSVVTVARQTTTKTRVVARAQQLVRYDEEDDEEISGEESAALLRAAASAINDADSVAFQDYNKGVLTASVILPAVSDARRRGIP